MGAVGLILSGALAVLAGVSEERVEELCAVAEGASAPADEELEALVAESDALLAELAQEEGAQELLDRLGGCRDSLWRFLHRDEEFARLCGAVEVAHERTPDELQHLIADCDALLEVFKKVDDRGARVYVFRLQKCRQFFAYTLELAQSEQSSGG